MNFTLHTPGRICLFGDYCDLIEQPCIAMAISAQMQFEFTMRNDDRVVVVSRNTKRTETYRLGERPNLSTPLKYVSAVFLRLASRLNTGFEIEIDSGIPIGVGLGSSAALLVGTICCLNQAFDLALKTADIAEMAHVIERHDLLIVSGRTDPYAIAYGGISYIETGIPSRVTPLRVGKQSVCCQSENLGEQFRLPIVVGHTGQIQDVDGIQRSLSQRLNDMTSKANQAMRRVIAIVQEGRDALQTGDDKRIGDLMNESLQMGLQMERSIQAVAPICDIAKEAGALGAKQIGGGGSMVAYCPDRQNEVMQALREAGYAAFAFHVFCNHSPVHP